ncbi:uncharacterized protein C8A04DRAFT_29107 [Dichotomopilus funicola]|uniref:Lysozyme n=1 Tax=Dichotomopilus funicola TaxID=1934379 RepID=A0AAN6ZMP6_9PEZI|nr:hypothetical protein C8A04DRAFT_29107 [Dichotomopilus funicola]
MHFQLLSALFFSGLAVAGPVACRQAPTPTPSAAPPAGSAGTTSSSGVDLAKAIAAVMPSANSCSGADFPDECRTAEQAAPFISKACADLSNGECAATVAVMGLESGDLKFKHNVSPGRPGQGTANMMQIDFITKYATDLFGAGKVSGKAPNDILALVTPDATNFGSAAWFLKTQCPNVRDTLKAGTDQGWLAFNECIGVSGASGDRMAYWTRAKQAFNL